MRLRNTSRSSTKKWKKEKEKKKVQMEWRKRCQAGLRLLSSISFSSVHCYLPLLSFFFSLWRSQPVSFFKRTGAFYLWKIFSRYQKFFTVLTFTRPAFSSQPCRPEYTSFTVEYYWFNYTVNLLSPRRTAWRK